MIRREFWGLVPMAPCRCPVCDWTLDVQCMLALLLPLSHDLAVAVYTSGQELLYTLSLIQHNAPLMSRPCQSVCYYTYSKAINGLD